MERADELSLAGPLAEDLVCERQSLVLPDGRSAVVVHHAPLAPVGGPPVVFFHGIQSHPGWFVGSAQALARAGREVFQVTRRGSGLDTGRRGDAASVNQLLDDTHAALGVVGHRTGAERVAVVAISWGGKLLTAYALAAEGPPIQSLTLVAPGIVPRVDVPVRTKLAIAAARCLCPRKYFDIPLNDPTLFTDSPTMREYVADDPLRLRRATARFLVVSALLDRLIARAADGSLGFPTTLILARRDRIIDNPATRGVLERLTGGGVRTVELDAAHTIEFEPDPGAFHEALRGAVGAA